MVPSAEPGLVRYSSSTDSSSLCLPIRSCGKTGGCDFGETEIENLRVSTLGDENVRRLDVAMNDALGVRRIQCIGNFNGKREDIFVVQRPPDAVFQCHAVQKFHGDECLAILLANFIYGADVGMIQCGRGLGFTLKTGECLRVAGNFLG